MTIASPKTEWSSPWSTIPEMLHACCLEHADREVVVDGDARLSYRDLWELSGKLACALQAVGVANGSRVAAWIPNGWQCVVVACATWRAGGALVPINTRNKGPEVIEVLRETEASVLFVPGNFLDVDYLELLVHEVGEPSDGRPFRDLETLTTVVELSPQSTPRSDSRLIGWTEFLELADHDSLDPHGVVVAGDVAEILFTSGTTGRPKGVVLDHRQLLESYFVYGKIAGIGAGDRYLMVMPFGHGGGLNGCILTSLIHGLTIVPLAVFNPQRALALIDAEQVTVLLGPPTLYMGLLDSPHIGAHDVTTVRVAFTGASIVAPTVIERIHKELGATRVINAYGIIEGCVISMTRSDDDDIIATTTGRALPDVEIRLLDPEASEVAVGTAGEVLVRSYGVARGYLNGRETPGAIDEDGWLHTGDVGIFDERGNLRIVDRLKDVIIVGGFNAYPAEIERTLLMHPEVQGASVIGLPDDRLGQVPHAFVVPWPSNALDESIVIEWCKSRLSNYKVPRHVQFLDALPLNGTDKVDKARLRTEYSPRATEAGHSG